MPRFSKLSKDRLLTCHKDIQEVCNELIKQYDFSVLEGHRGEKEQNSAYKKGNSQVRWPNSAHNSIPSNAVDLAPYPIDWDNLDRFREMIIRFDTIANMLREQGKISSHFVYGANWKTLSDYPHIERKEK